MRFHVVWFVMLCFAVMVARVWGVEGQMTVFYIGSIGGSVIPLLLVST